VTQELLPFDDESFDIVVWTQVFYYVEDPAAALAEIRRMLRLGGTVVITVPVVWEYDRGNFEHRFTEPMLRRLLANRSEVRVVESGGWGVSWAAVTGSLFNRVEERLAARRKSARGLRARVCHLVRRHEPRRPRARGGRPAPRPRPAPASDEPARQRTPPGPWLLRSRW
jgi:SAM-dependent methyltransferase